MSKTPSSETVKTASAPKFWWLVLLALLAAALLLLTAGRALLARTPSEVALRTPHAAYTLMVAATPEAQQRGLGGRRSPAPQQGMLFWFPDTVTRCFWMKDMRFSLDIIWLNEAKRVVHVEPHVSPATYPYAFCPSTPARYVIELPAGEAARAGIRPGETLTF